MNYECILCGSLTALSGACRGCGVPDTVEGRGTRRHGKSEIERLHARIHELQARLDDVCERCQERCEHQAMTTRKVQGEGE